MKKRSIVCGKTNRKHILKAKVMLIMVNVLDYKAFVCDIQEDVDKKER